MTQRIYKFLVNCQSASKLLLDGPIYVCLGLGPLIALGVLPYMFGQVEESQNPSRGVISWSCGGWFPGWFSWLLMANCAVYGVVLLVLHHLINLVSGKVRRKEMATREQRRPHV
jgi:hypothetical protein